VRKAKTPKKKRRAESQDAEEEAPCAREHYSGHQRARGHYSGAEYMSVDAPSFI